MKSDLQSEKPRQLIWSDDCGIVILILIFGLYILHFCLVSNAVTAAKRSQ